MEFLCFSRLFISDRVLERHVTTLFIFWMMHCNMVIQPWVMPLFGKCTPGPPSLHSFAFPLPLPFSYPALFISFPFPPIPSPSQFPLSASLNPCHIHPISPPSTNFQPAVKFRLFVSLMTLMFIGFASETIISWCLLIFDCQMKDCGHYNMDYYLMLQGRERLVSHRDCLSDYNKRGCDEYCWLVTAISSGQTNLIAVCMRLLLTWCVCENSCSG